MCVCVCVCVCVCAILWDLLKKWGLRMSIAKTKLMVVGSGLALDC